MTMARDGRDKKKTVIKIVLIHVAWHAKELPLLKTHTNIFGSDY